MPLIYCRDCGTQISDQAAACPKCGCPPSVSENTPEGDGFPNPEDIPSPKEGEVQGSAPAPIIRPSRIIRPGQRRPFMGRPIHRGPQHVRNQYVRRQNIYVGSRNGEGLSGMTIAGFAVGLGGLFFAAVICGPLALVFSWISLMQTSGKSQLNKGLAVTGLVLGGLDALAGLILVSHGLSVLWSWGAFGIFQLSSLISLGMR